MSMNDLLHAHHNEATNTHKGDKIAWLGRVHLEATEEQQNQEYTTTVAVWATNRDDFNKRLHTKIVSRHLRLLHCENAMPAVKWLYHYPGDYAALELAKGVFDTWPIAFGKLLPATQAAQETSKKQTTYLVVTELEKVAPLDDQFGVYPEKTVPDALYEPLFGRIEPTDAEIAQYGSPEAVPLLNTYAVVDAAKILLFDGPDFVGDLRCQCLFKGDAANTLKSVAPYLVQLAPEASFTKTLFSYHPAFSDNHSTVHLWHKEPGIYIRSRASFDELHKHLRKFTKVQREDNNDWVFFRFYEPEVINTYLQGITPKEQLAFLRHHILITCNKQGYCKRFTIDETYQRAPAAQPRYTNIAHQALQHNADYRLAKAISHSITNDYGQYNTCRGDALIELIIEAITTGRRYGCDTDLSFGQFATAVFVLGLSPEQLPEPYNTLMNDPLSTSNRRTASFLEQAVASRQQEP